MPWMSFSSPVRVMAPVLAMVIASLASANPSISLDDVSRLQHIDSIGVSPDGSMVACSVADACGGAGRTHSAHRCLWLVSLVGTGTPPIQLTTGARDDRHPVFAPDSSAVAFYRLDDAGRHQAHVIRVDGGEASALSSLPSGVDASVPPVWSPDGRRVLVTGWIEPQGGTASDATATGDVQVVESRSSRRGLWVLDARKVEPVSPEPLTGFRNCSEGVFAEDGRTIYCTVVLAEEPEPGRPRRTAIGRLELSGMSRGKGEAAGAVPILVQDQVIAFDDPGFDLSCPRISPSGEVVSVLGRSRRSPFFEPLRLGMFEVGPTAAPSPAWLTGGDAFDREVISYQWRAGQDALLLNALDDGGVDLLTISRTLLSRPRVLVEHQDDLPVGISSFGSGGGVVALVRCAVDSPSELWVLDARGLQRIWNPNQWLEGIDVSVPETGWVTPRGEEPIPYWLYRPQGIEDDARIPVVVWLGSGPGSMLGPGVFKDWFPTQLFAANGYAVLQVNPRGSAGYGRDTRRRIYRDFIRGPSRDVFAVLQHVRQQDQRLGSGGEVILAQGFAGMLATWMISAMPAIDAAVIEDGVFSVSTAYAEHADWAVLRELLGGIPQDPAVLSITREIDPAAHIDRIEASVLLVTGSTGGFVTTHSTNLMHRMLTLGYKNVQHRAHQADGSEVACVGQRDRFERILRFLSQQVERP